MPRLTKKSATFLILFLAILFILGIRFIQSGKKEVQSVKLGPRFKGAKNAKIKVIEFIDFRCVHCAHGSQYLKRMMNKYPGVFSLEMKYFPLSIQYFNALSARYAECFARQGKFWPFLDRVMNEQEQWRTMKDPNPYFLKVADDMKLDKGELQTCVADEEVFKYITESKKEGQILGVKSTPSYFINGEMVVGSRSLEEKITELLGGLNH